MEPEWAIGLVTDIASVSHVCIATRVWNGLFALSVKGMGTVPFDLGPITTFALERKWHYFCGEV